MQVFDMEFRLGGDVPASVHSSHRQVVLRTGAMALELTAKDAHRVAHALMRAAWEAGEEMLTTAEMLADMSPRGATDDAARAAGVGA